MADAERSSIEIKVLLRNLDPTKHSIKHKDRVRRLKKFRDYVTARPYPEFYDDDYNLLLLGSESPTAMEDEELENVNLVGLLRASGCPKCIDNKDSLIRSARPAISLLRHLCLDFGGDAKPSSSGGEDESGVVGLVSGKLNGFASALCALNLPQLRTLRFDLHVGGGIDGGGSKDDACRLLALILARHTDTDRETPKPLRVQDLLPDARSQAIFDSWLEGNAGPDVRRAIRENITAASHPDLEDHAGGGGGGAAAAKSTLSAVTAAKEDVGMDRNPFHDDDDDDVDVDRLDVFGKKLYRNHRGIVDYARSRLLPKKKGNDGTKLAKSAIVSSSSPRHDEVNDNDTLDSSLDIGSLESRVRAAALSRADEIRSETLRTGGTQADAEAAAVRAALSFYIDEEDEVGPSCGSSSPVMPLLLAASSSSMTKTTNADDPGRHRVQTTTTVQELEASSAVSVEGRSMMLLKKSQSKMNNGGCKRQWRALFCSVRRSAPVETRDVSSGTDRAPKEGHDCQSRDRNSSIDDTGSTSINSESLHQDDLSTKNSLGSPCDVESTEKRILTGKIGDMLVNFVESVHTGMCPGDTNYEGGTYFSTLRDLFSRVDLTMLPACGSEESENLSVGPVNPSNWRRDNAVSTGLDRVQLIDGPPPDIPTSIGSSIFDEEGDEVSLEDDYVSLKTRYLTPGIREKVDRMTINNDRAEVYRLLCQLRDWELDPRRVRTALRDAERDGDVSEESAVANEVDEAVGSEFIDVDEYIAHGFRAKVETSEFTPPNTSLSKQVHRVCSNNKPTHARNEMANESLSDSMSDTSEVTARPVNRYVHQNKVQEGQRSDRLRTHGQHHPKVAPHPCSGHKEESCSGGRIRGNDYNPNWRDNVSDKVATNAPLVGGKGWPISNATIATDVCQQQGVAPYPRGGQFPQVSPSSERQMRSHVCQMLNWELDPRKVPTVVRDNAEEFDMTIEVDEAAENEFIDVDEYIANVYLAPVET